MELINFQRCDVTLERESCDLRCERAGLRTEGVQTFRLGRGCVAAAGRRTSAATVFITSVLFGRPEPGQQNQQNQEVDLLG